MQLAKEVAATPSRGNDDPPSVATTGMQSSEGRKLLSASQKAQGRLREIKRLHLHVHVDWLMLKYTKLDTV